VAFLIRKDVFNIFCFIFLLYIILYLKEWKKLLIIFSVITVCFLGSNAYTVHYIKNIDPIQLQYQKARVSIIDWGIKPTETELENLGWNQGDYELLINFKGIDNTFYSKAAIIDLSKSISYKIEINKILSAPYTFLLYFISDIYYYSIGLIFLSVLYYSMRKYLRFIFSFQLIWILFFYILAIIIVHYRLYIYYTLLFYLSIIGSIYIVQKANSKNLQAILYRNISYLFLILFSLCSTSSIFIIHNRIVQFHLKSTTSVFNSFDKKIVELQMSNKQFLTVGEESESLFSKWATFRSLKNNSDERLAGRIIPTGWFINTVQFDNIVNGSIIKSLIEGHLYFLGNDKEFFIDLKGFILRHYSLKVDIIEDGSFQYSKVYRLIIT
jgi:hypothetical protein